MPIVIKEIIVKTTVEKSVRNVPVDEQLIRRVKEQIKEDLTEEHRYRRDRDKNR